MGQNPLKSDVNSALRLCKGGFLAAAGFSMVINILMLTPTIYMLQLYDRVLSSRSESTLLMLTLIVSAIYLTQGTLEWVRGQLLVKIGTQLEVLLSQRVFKIAYKQALYSSGQRASSQALDDLTALRQFLTGSSLFAFFDAPWMPFYVAVMFVFHPLYGWTAVGAIMLLLALAIINEKTTHPLLAEANALAVSGRLALNKNLKNAEVIESMGMLQHVLRRWQMGSEKILYLQGRASTQAGLLTALSKTLRLFLQSLILGLGAYLAIHQEITPGLMIAGSILLGRALAPIDMLIASWKGVIVARAQYQRLNTWCQQLPEDAEKMPLPEPKGDFLIEQAVVIPPGAKLPALNGINLSISRGDIVGVLGASGAGKTTFVRALLGIWPAAKGAFRLDGADIFAWDRMALGPHIGYLPQDIELFDGSISDNIARFGAVDPELVVRAAQMAGVHELILRLPEGYDTQLGASGGILSSGQRQRIALARALYGNPCVVVLDEPNSNLDQQGELALAEAIKRLKSLSVTVIIVSHRESVLDLADKLLILNEGQVAVYGPRLDVIQFLQQQAANSNALIPAGRPR